VVRHPATSDVTLTVDIMFICTPHRVRPVDGSTEWTTLRMRLLPTNSTKPSYNSLCTLSTSTVYAATVHQSTATVATTFASAHLYHILYTGTAQGVQNTSDSPPAAMLTDDLIQRGGVVHGLIGHTGSFHFWISLSLRPKMISVRC